jgi:hypothetical protein
VFIAPLPSYAFIKSVTLYFTVDLKIIYGPKELRKVASFQEGEGSISIPSKSTVFFISVKFRQIQEPDQLPMVQVSGAPYSG